MIDSKNDNDGKSKCNKTHLQLEQRKQILELLHQGFNQEIRKMSLFILRSLKSRNNDETGFARGLSNSSFPEEFKKKSSRPARTLPPSSITLLMSVPTVALPFVMDESKYILQLFTSKNNPWLIYLYLQYWQSILILSFNLK